MTTFDDAMNVLSHAAANFRSHPSRNIIDDGKDKQTRNLLMSARKEAIIKELQSYTLEDKVVLLIDIKSHPSAKNETYDYDAIENWYLDRWVVQSIVESIGSWKLGESRADMIHNTLNSNQIKFLLNLMNKRNMRNQYQNANWEEWVIEYDIFVDVLNRAAAIDDVQGGASSNLSKILGGSTNMQ